MEVVYDFNIHDKRRVIKKWCRRGDSNPYGNLPLPPQDSVSACSTTSALNDMRIYRLKLAIDL